MTTQCSPGNETLLTKAQAFVDRKYVARADDRQRSMGLAYVEAERQDLARELVMFVRSLGDVAQGPSDTEQVFIEICDELGCAYDNESALMEIDNLKRRAAGYAAPPQATRAMPLEKPDGWIVKNDLGGVELFLDHERAVRALSAWGTYIAPLSIMRSQAVSEPLAARETIIKECEQAARGPVYREIYNGSERGNWSRDSDYGRGRHDAADTVLSLSRPVHTPQESAGE